MKRHLLAVMLLFFGLTSEGFAQIAITGTVVASDNQEELPGVNVVLRGTNRVVVTDINGRFNITVPSQESILQFSFIGFKSREVRVGNQTDITISLDPSTEALNEVVVTAFGIERDRKSLGYAVQEIDNKLILETNQPNALNALRGRIAGVNITSSSGAPGAGTNIVIRGINSLNPNADNQPLFVIDGIPISNETNITGGRGGSNFTNTNRAADINPDDIESISILKGPAASVLYGLRAANGAVIITTKSGKAGKTTFNYRTSASIDQVGRTPPMQQNYLRGFNGLYNPTDYRSDGPPVPAGTPVFNQWDETFRTGNTFQNNFSFSGGSDKATFFGSLGRLDQSGILPNSNFDRTNIKIAGSLKASDKLTLDGSATFINSNGINPRMGVGGAGVISYASRYAPDVNISDFINPDGSQIRYSTILDNPLYFAQNAFQEESVNRLLGNLGATYLINDWLTASYRVGIDQYTDKRFILTSPTTLIGAGANGSISEQIIGYQELNSNFLLTGERKLSDNLNMVVTIGNQLTTINSTSLTASGSNFVIPDFWSVNNLSQYQARSFPSSRTIIGVFADAKFDYKQTLFLNITGRNDWSSTLPRENRSFFYPSVSMSYIFTETLKLSPSSVLSYGKLRGSFAEVGKDAAPFLIGNYYSTLVPFRGIVGVARNGTIGSENLRPERTRGLEFGLDIGLFKNRLRIDANYAIQTSIDQIIPIPVSRATGFTNFVVNAGEIRNNIWELTADIAVVQKKDFSWNSIFNWSRLRGKVISLPEGLDQITFQPETPWVKQRVQVGGRPGDWFGWPLSRVEDPNSPFFGQPVIVDGYPNVNNQWRGVPLAEDSFIGNAFPDWEGGWNNSIRYKNLELSFLFTFRKGGYVFDINRRLRYGQAGGEAPTGAETELRNRLVVFNGVRNTGTIENPVWVPNDQPVPIGVSTLYGQAFRYRLASEFNGFQEASWLRLQNVALNYTLPTRWIDKTPFNSITASVTANNLWLTTPFVGFDPEQSAYGPGSNVFGYVGTNVPATSSVFFGLNFNF
ncbi:SusC/RagA family TonB-linked outer membrane protein [Mongoliitalea daihaiensis]|uniref:SusC/RagA family TonB-linked outer membrane protein n=1 Tax=Mongoliitalea daihaiensis TaxID=2782006 RepID=UPI001F371127|nr:SusC/RagA family TonB-linked outer membrane protein [Mongoliitalea daihaiensis]UJP63697.1 SusC/RagA family TonB-linked outer membrane protein [Mongoliitalea daihaiensis]